MDKKVGIVGVGNVGATLAFVLATKNLCSELLLRDVRDNIVQAMALDVSQSAKAANSSTFVRPCLSPEEFQDCDVVVVTAGSPRKPGMSRDDLLLINAKIMDSVIADVVQYNPNAIIIVVSNPLDAMVYTALKRSNFPRERVIGMAGILDSSRMSHFIQEKIGKGVKNISSNVMGGHGDEMVPLTNISTVDGQDLHTLLDEEEIEDVVYKTRHGGAQIVKFLETGSAYYAPAFSTSLMVESILLDKKETYPCAILLDGEFGYKNVVAGVPTTLGKDGVEFINETELSNKQNEEFQYSINAVKELIETLESNFFAKSN